MPRACEYDRVLEVLRESGAKGLTLKELSLRLEVGETCLRRHLRLAETKGLVDKDSLESQGKRGRPAKTYFIKALR